MLRFPPIEDRRRNLLSDRQSECVHLFWDCQMTQRQVAGMLGISQVAVSGHLRRAYDRIHRGGGEIQSLDETVSEGIEAVV